MQRLRHGTGLAEGCDEVYVAEPAGQNVHVKMSGDAGTGGFPKVHADVEAIGVIDLFKCGLRSLGQVHHFIGDLFIALVKIGDMLEWQDHQMARAVGIYIENDKIKLGAPEDEFLLIARRVVQDITENAAARFFTAASCYVVISPWTPNDIHTF